MTKTEVDDVTMHASFSSIIMTSNYIHGATLGRKYAACVRQCALFWLVKTAGAVSQKIGFMSAECACGSTGADVVGLACLLHRFAFGLAGWPAGGDLSLGQVRSPAGGTLTSGGTTAAPQLDELGYS